MKNEKFLTVICVAVLVVISIVVFLKVFMFESEDMDGDYLTYPTITDEYIDNLYLYLDGYSSNVTSTMYSGSFTKSHNLSYSVIMAMGYNYLINYDSDKIENIVGQAPSEGDATVRSPISKFSEEDLLGAIEVVFGKDVKLSLGNFEFEKDRVGYDVVYNSDEKMFYVYQNDGASNIVVFHGITKYEVANNGNTIIIYDYYLKCNLDSGRCYNDEKMQQANTYYKVVNGEVDLTDQSNLKTYSHTFEFDNDNYYWLNSNIEQ